MNTSVRHRLGRPLSTLSMLACVGLVLALAIWSAARERRAALEDFTREQELLATAVGADFEARLSRTPGDVQGDATVLDELVVEMLAGARQLEQRGSGVLVLVARPGARGFLTSDRRVIASARLRAALDAGAPSVEIPRDEAVSFGLAPRRAIAGLDSVAPPGHGRWGVVVLASAERLRVREEHEAYRLALTVLAAAAVVAAFGAASRARQRREVELERHLTAQAFERERDGLLAREGKLAAVAALSTGIAHELGTPLGVIAGRVEIVLARGTDARTASALNIVLEQVERIQGIVRGCLALARGERPDLVRASPRTIADRATSLVRHRFETSGVVLDSETEEDLPDIACEPLLLEQALVNLLLNAAQASARGDEVRLSVSSEGTDVLFVVEDDGVGVSDELAARATTPFFSTKRELGGSGLGLTIAREITSHHAGTLGLERRSGGRGTRAWLRVPRT